MTDRAATAPLQEDIRLLGDVLGDTIRRCEGTAFFTKVEHLRRQSKWNRGRHSGTGLFDAHAKIAAAVRRLPDDQKYKMAKAFTVFLQLANVAEKTHRIRRRRFHRRAGRRAQRLSPEETFAGLARRKIPAAQIKSVLTAMEIDLVMTAHPTETLSPDIIRVHRDLSSLLLLRDNATNAPEDNDRIVADIRAIVYKLWQTAAIRREKPTPFDEALYGLDLATTILWDAVPQFFRELRGAFNRAIGTMTDIFPCPVRFSSWMGGDRDGHAGVTAAVTRHVIETATATTRKMYRLSLTDIAAKLDFKPESAAAEKIQTGCRKHLAMIADLVDTAPSRKPLMTALEKFKSYLQKNRLWVLVADDYQDMIWRVRVFGLNMLKLDIRQDSGVHRDVLARLVDGYADMTPAAQVDILRKYLAGKTGIAVPKKMPAMAREVMATMRLIDNYPAGYFGCYIISMAESAADILAVHVLMKLAGVKKPLPVAPLFETPDTLAAAADVMAELYAAPAYRKIIGKRQHIMLGYSDSGKRGGYIQAAWDIYTQQQKLVSVGKKYGIETVFFHGRGGAIARGGGPIELAIAALPAPVASPCIRITEQGEVINARYGVPGIAGRTMEIYFSSFIGKIFAKPPRVKRAWIDVMDRLAAASAADFRRAVYEDPAFMPHYTQLTPAREMDMLKIGSRPGKRKKDGGLESLRAIPWVFSWTQARTLFPVWKGATRALRREEIKILQDMYHGWDYFRSMIDLIEIGASLADPAVTHYYNRRLVDKNLQHKTDAQIREIAAVRQLIRRIKGADKNLDDRAVLKRSIALRTPYVDVLNVMQAELLSSYRAGTLKGRGLDALVLTFNGISAGMHNTG